MTIRAARLEKYPTFAEGVDDTSNIASQDTINTLSIADNVNLVDDSLATKRNGYTPVHSAWSTRRIRQGFEFKNQDATKSILVYGEDSAVTGTSGVLAKLNGASTPTVIASSLKDGVKPVILQFRSLGFIFNGDRNIIYTGTGIRDMGIPAPLSAPAFVSFIAGDKNTEGSYTVAYTYYNSTTGAESSPSDFSDTIITGTTAGQTGFRMSVNPGDPTLADRIRGYVTVSGSQDLFFEKDVPINSTFIDFTLPDTQTGDELELDNTPLLSPAAFGVVNDNRIFVGGFATNPNRIQYSKIGRTGAMPESFQVEDFVDCNINDGDKIIGMGVIGTVVIVIKERSVGKLIRISATGLGLERGGSQKYIYEEISKNTTALSHHLILVQDNLCVWLGRDDIYATDGTQIIRLGRRIRNTIRRMNNSLSWKFSAINDTQNQQLIFSVCRGGEVEPDFQFVGHYRNAPKIAFTYYRPGPNKSTHPGITAASFFQVTVNSEPAIYFGSSAAEGLTHQLGVGTSDNGKDIYFQVASRWESIRNLEKQGTFHSYYFFATGTGVAPNNTILASFEKDSLGGVSVKSRLFQLSISSSNWSVPNWSQFLWGSLALSPLRFFPQKKAYFGRCVFSNYYKDQPIAIKSVTSLIQED